MNLSNEIISVEIDSSGAELKSVKKNGYEYMWCADGKYWGRTSPVLFPIVGGLNGKKYIVDCEQYSLGQHGFARDCEFAIAEKQDSSVAYVLKSDEKSRENYPFDFSLEIKYILNNSTLGIEWTVKNEDDKTMYFSIGAHPAFNLKEGKNYFGFDTKKDIIYSMIDENGLYIENDLKTLENDGYTEIDMKMFDNDALIVENNQAKEISLCDGDKVPYVTVKFDAPLFGLWSPAKKNAPFVCIEPWYGRCDKQGFDGEFSKKDYIISLEKGGVFKAGYEIEFN